MTRQCQATFVGECFEQLPSSPIRQQNCSKIETLDAPDDKFSDLPGSPQLQANLVPTRGDGRGARRRGLPRRRRGSRLEARGSVITSACAGDHSGATTEASDVEIEKEGGGF